MFNKVITLVAPYQSLNMKLAYQFFSICFIVAIAFLAMPCNTRADTLTVNKHLRTAWSLRRSNTDSASYHVGLARSIAQGDKDKTGLALSDKIEASVIYNRGDYEESVKLAFRALNQLKSIKAPVKDIASTLNLIGLSYMSIGNYSQAEKYFTEANSEYQKINDIHGQVSTIHNIGVTNFYYGNYDKAMEYYTKALKKLEEGSADLLSEIDITTNIAILLNQEKQFERAINYYRKALRVQTKLNDRKGIGSTLTSIGISYFAQGNYDSSFYYHSRALDYFKEGKMESGISMALNNMGEILLLRNNNFEALELFKESKEIREKANEQYGLAISCKNLGRVFTQLKNWVDADKYFKQALNIGHEINSPYILAQVYQSQAEYYALKGDYKEAYKHNQMYHLINDSLFSTEKSIMISNLQERYKKENTEKELLKKNNKIQLLEKEKHLVKLYYIGSFIFLLLAIVAIWLYLSRKKMQVENKLLQSERDKVLLKSEAELHQSKFEIEKNKKEEAIFELENKKQEIVQMALYISQQNEYLENFKKGIQEIKEDKQMLMVLEKEFEQKLNLDKQREQFTLNINLINEDFYTSLHHKFPQLSDNEKKLCAMLRLNLSSKEIASILNISPKSVDMNRYRLRKKLEIPTHIELYDFFMSV
ncbi:MAG: tetratricopeptide repeat protein [Bacteroidia bacterium]|nr:tetratricopeptide repeat protein [Bacteroidia bacterium]MCZ2248192.1 tetratricopeptide repeat protein [Bacteroidia bacterium]